MMSSTKKVVIPTTATTTMTSKTDELLPLSKKQRGRLKKLKKRATEEKEGCETSGIASMSDWMELQTLGGAPPVGPSVRQRKKNQGGDQNAEGVDHRDIIFQCLERTNQSKKRCRDEISANIPPWATLHNPSGLQSLAVVEIHLDNKENSDWDTLLSSIPILEQLKRGDESAAVTARTRWFQGPKVKSVTDSLMYFQPSPKDVSKNQKQPTDTEGDSTCMMISRLKEMLLTASQREKEGYPMIAKRSGTQETKSVSRNKVSQTTIPTLEEAKQSVGVYQVSIVPRVEGGDEVRNFVATTESADGTGYTPRVFALDCEMVLTSSGQELARITMIQLVKVEDGKMSHTVVLDELVKPVLPVLDYVTKYSGITAQILGPIQTRLEQIQAFLVNFLNGEDILVGHSLENDLQAVCLAHDTVVDTSVLFRGNNSRKYSLKHLTVSLLKRTIQAGESGHCSEEDAVASLELAISRLQEGPSFRIHESSNNRVHLLESLRHDVKPIVCIGPSSWLKKHVTPFSTSAHALTCENVEDDSRKALTAWLVNPKRRAKLAWAHLRARDQDSLHVLNEAITDLVQRALPGTLILIALQSGVESAHAVAKERKARMNPRSSLGWTEENERNWRDSSDCSRSGYALWLGTK